MRRSSSALVLLPLLLLVGPGEALGQARDQRAHDDAVRIVQQAATAHDDQALDRALDALIAEDSPRVVDALVDLAVRHPRRYPYELARYHLAYSIAAPGSLLHLAQELRTARDARVRVTLADACTLREDESSGQALDAAVLDRDDRVALMAVRGVKHRRRVPAVDALIERYAALQKDRRGVTVLLYEVEAALLRITGEQFRTAAEWVSFWAARRDGFVPPSGERRLLEQTRERPRFFGTELRSDRVVFVIDVSGSMRHGEPTRLERTKVQLTALIDQLSEGAEFAVFAYSGLLYDDIGLPAGTPTTGPLPEVLDGKRWLWHTGPKLLRATAARKRAAREFVAQLQPDGSTFTLEALSRALAVQDADLVVLLSDGQPEEVDRARNRYYSEEEIIEEFARINRFRCVRVDTWGLGGGGDSFLELLAERTGGSFTRID